MLRRGSKYSGGIASVAVISGSPFLVSRPRELCEAIKAPCPFPDSSEIDVALPFLVTPSPIETLVESLIDNRLLLMTRMECDLTMRESSIGDLLTRIHMLKLDMMINPRRGDFSQLIEQHNELVNLNRHALSQQRKKRAEYEMLIGQIYSLLRLRNGKMKNKPALIEDRSGFEIGG
jgi:hypothetical protein